MEKIKNKIIKSNKQITKTAATTEDRHNSIGFQIMFPVK